MNSPGANAGSVLPGTFSGTILVLIANVESAELIKTALVAAVGASVSFLFSLILQYIKKRFL